MNDFIPAAATGLSVIPAGLVANYVTDKKIWKTIYEVSNHDIRIYRGMFFLERLREPLQYANLGRAWFYGRQHIREFTKGDVAYQLGLHNVFPRIGLFLGAAILIGVTAGAAVSLLQKDHEKNSKKNIAVRELTCGISAAATATFCGFILMGIYNFALGQPRWGRATLLLPIFAAAATSYVGRKFLCPSGICR